MTNALAPVASHYIDYNPSLPATPVKVRSEGFDRGLSVQLSQVCLHGLTELNILVAAAVENLNVLVRRRLLFIKKMSSSSLKSCKLT
jgi:hypothetical protein